MSLTTTATTTTDGTPYSVTYDLADSVDQTTSSIVVTVVVEDDQAASFKRNMLGWSEINGDGTLDRRLPEVAKWGNERKYYCVKLDPVGKTPKITDGQHINNDDGWPEFSVAMYRATFVIPLYTVLSDTDVPGGVGRERHRFCIWTPKLTATNEKIPGGGFKFVDDTLPANGGQISVPEVGVRAGRVIGLQCKWIDVPRFDVVTLSGFMNRINDSDFEMNGELYEVGTVLLTGVAGEQKINSRGHKAYDITFDFAIRADGRNWNKFWKSGTAGYVEISDNGLSTGTKPYDSVTFDLLWSFQ